MATFTLPSYTPANWYWFVAGDETKVYSSAAGRFVQLSNKAYEDWLASGGRPSRIISLDELAEVLSNANVRPIDADMLDRYKTAHAGKLTLEIVAKLLFAIVNDRRVDKGEEPFTPAEFKAWIKERM